MRPSSASARSSRRCRSPPSWKSGACRTPTTSSRRSTRPSTGRMATEIKLPRLGQGMESGTIVKWLKSEGDRVEKGEPLYELDTDKVTQEVESDASGVLLKIAVAEGEVPVGRTIAVIGEQGEQVAAEPTAASSDGGGAARVAESREEEGSRAPARDDERQRGARATAEPVPPQMSFPDATGGRVKASP